MSQIINTNDDADASSTAVEDEPKTPKRSGFEQPFEYIGGTPAMQRTIHSSAYRSGILEPMRQAAREEFGDAIREISLASFIKYLLPPLKDGIDVSKLVSRLKREEDSIIDPTSNTLKAFETIPSRMKGIREDEVFAPLGEICTRICRVASEGLERSEPNFILVSLPHLAPISQRGSKARPDAFFCQKAAIEVFAQDTKGNIWETRGQPPHGKARKREAKATSVPSWLNIAAPLELKKDKPGQNDNVEKILFHIQQIMAQDPRRRFTFGITVEDNYMRLWFCSRSLLTTSQPFDFTTDVENFVHVFLALSFASEEELGWDPTIDVITGGNDNAEGNTYLIQVKERKYVSNEVLSEDAADASVSSGTRVWKVTDLESKETRVLKDVWVEDDRMLEHSIYANMLRDVEEKYGVVVRDDVASHLLTPVAYWEVHVNGIEDHTTKVMMRGYTPPTDGIFPLRTEESNRVTAINSAGAPSAIDKDICETHLPDYQLKAYCPRKHYRVVFLECAKPVYVLRRLADVFTVLKDSSEALQWIHGCGWVHRDIGAANLYLHNGRGLIGDLEYARRKDSDTPPHQMITGSADFMAIEIARRAYHFVQPADNSDADFEDDSSPGRSKLTPSFFHNDLHDLESLWWVAIYVFAINDISAVPALTVEKARQRKEFAKLLFPRSPAIESRRDFLCLFETFRSRLSWMPECLNQIKRHLNKLRTQLLVRYHEFEGGLPNIDLDVIKGVQQTFREVLESCEVDAGSMELAPRKATGIRLSNNEQNVQMIHQQVTRPSTLRNSPADLPLSEPLIDNSPEIPGPSGTKTRRRSQNDGDFADRHPKNKRRRQSHKDGNLRGGHVTNRRR